MAQLALSIGDHFFEADGVCFHYLVRGAGSLVILQSVGWGMPGSYLWNGMGMHLEAAHTVLYFEPRGNGSSSRPEDHSTMTAKTMAADLEHLRIHLGLDKLPFLAGHSHGAAIVLRYAEQWPDRVERIVLVDAQVMDAPPTQHTLNWIVRRRNDPAYAASVAVLLTLGGEGPPTTNEEFQKAMDVLLPWYFSDPAKEDILRQHIAAGPLQADVFAFQTNKNDTKPENQLPHLTDTCKVKAKTLIIWGQEDPLCSLDSARALEVGIKGAKLAMIEGVGHFPWIEDPETFWAALVGFGQDAWEE